MAQPRRKSANAGDISREAVKRLWKHVDVRAWHVLLREADPHRGWQINGRTIKARCPYHDDSDPSFILNFDRGLGKCFGTCGKVVVDIIELFRHLRGSSYQETVLWLDSRIGIQDLIGKNTDDFAKYHRVQELKKYAAMAFSEVVQEYVREKPDCLSYLEPGITYLEAGRGIARSLLPQLPVALFPKPEHAKRYVPHEYHEDYDAYFAKYVREDLWGSPIFHYNDSPGTISRFKVRKMERTAAKRLENLKKAGTMHPDDVRALCTKTFEFLEDPVTQATGIFGLHHYVRSIGKAEACVYITEGEFDALSVMVGQIEAERSDITILAASGKGAQDVSFLQELGIRAVYVVQDSPVKNGDGVACGFLSQQNNFKRTGSLAPMAFKIFCWPAGLTGGDLDEAVRLNGYETVSRFLYADRNKYFLDSGPWVEEKSLAAVKVVDGAFKNAVDALNPDDETYSVQLKNLESDRERDIIAIARTWLGFIHEPSDKLAFSQHLAHETGVDVVKLEGAAGTIYSVNTAEGARARVREALSEYLGFSYYTSEVGSKTKTFYLWAKKRRESLRLPPSDDTRREMCASLLGMPFLDWMKSILGENSILEDRCKLDASPLECEKRRMANAQFLVGQVFEELLAHCPSDEDLRPFAQGIHMHSLPDAEKRKNNIYIVNGSLVFRGTYNLEDAVQPLEWEMLDTPVHGGMKFLLSKGAAWSHISDVSDLYAASSVDLKKLYLDILRLLDAWEFEHDDVNKAYLAAWIMSVPTMAAVHNVNLTYITGESASGKTSLLKGLLGGCRESTHDVPAILEAAKFTADATRAWMQQEMDRSALLLVIDEAEAGSDSQHNESVRAMQEMMLSIPMGGARVSRGGATQEARIQYELRMPIVMGGIHMNADATFLSRVFIIYTKKDPKRRACGEYIADAFTQDRIEEIRKQITVALLPYVPKLATRRNSLRRELASAASNSPASSRFIDNVLTPLAVYELIDPDHHKPAELFGKIIEANKPRLEAINNVSFQSEVIDAALFSRSIRYSTADNVVDYRPARQLIREGEINLLNSTGCGVYCIPEKRWIVIDWRSARYGVLARTGYDRKTDSALKESVSHNNNVVHGISPEEHEFICSYLNMTDARTTSDYTVVRLDYLMNAQEQAALTGVAEEKFAEREEDRARKAEKRDRNARGGFGGGWDNGGGNGGNGGTVGRGPEYGSARVEAPSEKPAEIRAEVSVSAGVAEAAEAAVSEQAASVAEAVEAAEAAEAAVSEPVDIRPGAHVEVRGSEQNLLTGESFVDSNRF